MTVYYEWDVETVTTIETDEYEVGEVLNHHHCNTYSEALDVASSEPEYGTKNVIVLVRDDNQCRSWAYLENGNLPEYFEDAFNKRTAKVPMRFVKEIN